MGLPWGSMQEPVAFLTSIRCDGPAGGALRRQEAGEPGQRRIDPGRLGLLETLGPRSARLCHRSGESGEEDGDDESARDGTEHVKSLLEDRNRKRLAVRDRFAKSTRGVALRPQCLTFEKP